MGDVHDPVVVGAARLAIGGGALVLVALVTCGPAPLLGWTALAAIATAVHQSAFFSAVAGIGVATGTVVALGTAPVPSGLCGAVLVDEHLRHSWAGATAVAGCVVL